MYVGKSVWEMETKRKMIASPWRLLPKFHKGHASIIHYASGILRSMLACPLSLVAPVERSTGVVFCHILQDL